jgi:DNA helicase-2/ATP-dependent DNA helicase PcrA
MAYIAGKIKEHIGGGGQYNDIAVIYRSNYISRFVEECLRKINVPYTVYGGVGFYERKEIKDVLSYLRLAANGDDLSFCRVVNTPRRGMGKKKLDFLKQRAEKDKTTLYEALKEHAGEAVFAGSGAKEFLRVMEHAVERAGEMQVSELLQYLLHETKYEAYLRETGDMDRLDNVTELLRSVAAAEAEYGEPLTLETFMRDISLGMDIQEAAGEKNDSIKIMTAHVSKGLEFHTVIITGLTEGTFPSARALEERLNEALEEERRLCYVAMTRAKKRLYMTESEGFGFRSHIKTPSRFLFDISDSCITRIGHISSDIMEEHAVQTVLRNPYKDTPLPIGAEVKHKVFGEGVIESSDMNTRTYMIRFMAGIKPIRFDYKNLWKNI